MDVSKHLEKAAEALRKKNFDYAISLYHQVLQLKPDHGEARRELRQALVRRAEYKKVPPFIALLQGAPSRVGMLLGKVLKNRGQVVLAAENYLRNDPRNRGVNWSLAEALEAAGHRNGAVAVWEFLGEDEQVGDEALKRAGSLYYQLQQMEKALGCYEAVLKRSPRDSEAEKMRKNLAAEGVLSSGSYDPTRSSRELARDQKQVKELEASQKLVTTEDERELLRAKLGEALAADPSDRRARRALVDHHVKAKEFERAVEVLEEGIAADPDATDLRDRLGEVRILDFEQQLRRTKALADRGDQAAKTDLVDITREKREFEVEEYTRRVKDHPTDLEQRYRLGRLLLETGETDKAIENLQLAVKDPRRRVESLLGLGRAFESKGMLDLAMKQFTAALDAVDAGSDRATEITYALGILNERTGDLAAAKARYESIYERDIHFKDVAARLEKVRSASTAEAARTAPEAPKAIQREKTDEPSAGDAAGGSLYDFKD
ncbi:MAG: tetratricopeptide repeat protein [Planctomycetota bacterium JB042]